LQYEISIYSNSDLFAATILVETKSSNPMVPIIERCVFQVVACDHPYKIGGPELSVEIDESVISKRKYHRGRMVPERWIFDGYCCTSGRGFLELVPDRSAEKLLPLVQKYIHPGSLILSD